MGGVFADWQPRYAKHGIATFPVRDKRPAVSNYLRMGARASAQLTSKFASAEALGFACRPSGISVLDVDAPDERLLADALGEFGPTPIIIRSGSGNFQAWYRHNGEKRRVRPDPRRPIDILGDGFVVAPPSKGAKGGYSIIEGSLEDLARLPAMRRPQAPAEAAQPVERVQTGRRNDTLFRECLKRASSCARINELMEFAMTANPAMFYEPLPDAEVVRIVASAWGKELSGDNWVGRGSKVAFATAEVDDLLKHHPDAFILLAILRRHHWGREFVAANAMAETMPNGGWPVKRFAAARRRLEEIGEIVMVKPASKQHGPALYRFKGGQK